MNSIEIAELSQIDGDAYAQLTTLIIKTWEYDDWLEDDQVSPMAEYFLNDIILSSQKIYVARCAQQIIGIITVGQSPDFLYESQFSYKRLTAMSALIARNGKSEVFAQYIDTLRVNQRLLQRTHRHYHASLNFFAIDAQFRGLGLGNRLYHQFITYLQAQGIDTFFVFTDSSSNYQFYEKKGLHKIASETFYWRDEDEVEEYYLYEGHLAATPVE
ncbi:GNAT family N-acetyltransferase [Edwardsiella tarda]|uniref:GNAT family N-acetyltransferase n=1 Tax=Edwardsiella tarda TaxID=636 RepID=UPI001FA816DA|nr:GNAT family N-acetyltransferase [Edwardsiella tarda]UCQ19459.1 GNAT family N-acetyltransferase [Edwardsiella tarda]